MAEPTASLGHGANTAGHADAARPTVSNPASASVAENSLRSPARKRGRPPGSGTDARERLIEAAGRLFADRGYAGVSTREVAGAAGVNLSAISYHFGGKRELYRSVVEQLIADLAPRRQVLVEMLTHAVDSADGDHRQLAAITHRFVQGVLSFMLGGEMPPWHIQLILREVNQPSLGFDLILNGHLNPLHDAIARLVGAATGQDPVSPASRLLTQSIIGMCLSFGPVRSVVLARLAWDQYTPERIEQVVAVVAPAVVRALGLDGLDAKKDVKEARQ